MVKGSDERRSIYTDILWFIFASLFTLGFKWGSCYSILSFMCMLCRSMFLLLYYFFWPFCCLFFFNVRILITLLISFGHCVVCSSSMYGFWLLLWYLLAFVLSVLLQCKDSDYSFGIFMLFLLHCQDSLVIISIDLLKDVVCMCLILSCSLYLQFFKRNRYFDFRHMFLLVLSSFWSLWSRGVPLSMLCATK